MINKRIFEIDFLKVTAIILMIIFHFIYDLNEFVGLDINYQSSLWYWLGRVAAVLFIFLAGINSGFSKKPIKHGMIVFSCGMIITLVSLIMFKEEFVRFGVLHFLGISMMLFPLLKSLNNWILIIFALVTGILFSFDSFVYNTKIIIFLENIFGRPSFDYYPLFPYLSLFILGILVYKILYYKKKSIFNLYTKNKIIIFVSKHSLLIYLIHQPIILGIIFIIKYFI